jgi:hypothetical protein
MSEIVRFYKSNNIPFDTYLDELSWGDKKYVLMYYDIFPSYKFIKKYEIYIDPMYKEDFDFLVSLIKKYVKHKEFDKLYSLIKMFKLRVNNY